MNELILQNIKEKAKSNHVPIIMDDTLEVIEKYIGDKKIEKILEIGTAVGYSAICFTKFLSENGKIDTIERNEEMIKQAKSNIKDMEKENFITIYEGDAVDILPKMNDKYDLIFIDAAKGKYPFFLEQSLRMLKKDGIIFADNVLFKGYVLSDYNKHKQRTAVNHLREFIKTSTEDTKLETKIIDVGDGLAIIKFK